MRYLLPGLVALGLAGACSASGNDPSTTTSAGGAQSGGAGGSASSSSGLNLGGFINTGGGTPVGSCSADLQSIVDEQGGLIKACPPDQGCEGGVCVPACSAAAASKGSIGCDFYAPDPPFYRNGEGSIYDGTCYAVFVANTWSRSAQITVQRNGQSFDLTQLGRIPSGIIPNITYDPVPSTGVPPNQVAVLFLSHKPGAHHDLGTPLTCPVTPALVEDAAVPGAARGAAFHVVSDTPITAYDILPYGGAQSYLPSASLLFPATAWGTNYVAIGPHTAGGGSQWMMIVGSAPQTTVTVLPGATLIGGGSMPTAPAGQATQITVNAGEIAQWIGADPTSTIVEASAPIGVFTGSTYLSVSTATSPGGGGQDSAHQQIPHVKALGSEYVAPGVATRLASQGPESVPYRILGVVDGTTLTYEPSAPPGAPATLAVGQVAEFETTSLFVVRSQDDDHPFALTQYLPGTPSGNSGPGCGPQAPFPTGSCQLGDEEWVNLLAPRQFLQRYVFFTDPTYATTNLVITRVKGASGFSPVTVGCLGAEVGGWVDVGTSGNYQVAHVDLVRGAAPIASCTGSRHEAKSEGRFGVMVWGTDWYSSYGYPAGGNVGSINNVVVPPVPK